MANVTAVTKISYTKGLGGLSNSIKYLLGSPHYSNYGEIKHRDFVIYGWNCSSDPHDAYKEMRATLNRCYINHMNISAIRCIQSFKGLNYRSYRDRQTALFLDSQFIAKKYPNCQALLFGQCDNKHHMVHFHNIICARQFTDGASVAHNSSWFKTAPVMDQVLRDNHYTPLHHGYLLHAHHNRSRGVVYHYHHGGSFVHYVANQVNKASSVATDSNDFARLLQANGIHVERFKMTTRKGTRAIKEYSHLTKHGNYKRLSDGHFARFRKHWSYSFYWHGKHLVVRESKLGSDYYKGQLLSRFRLNEFRHHVRQITHKVHIKPIHSSRKPVKFNHHHYHHYKSLVAGLQSWNFRELRNDKHLAKMLKSSQTDSDNDNDDSDFDFSSDLSPTFHITNGLTW